MQNKLDTAFCGKEPPVPLKIIQYGFEHPEFSKNELKNAVGLDDDVFNRYWLKVEMVKQLKEEKFCLTIEGIAVYLQLLNSQHAHEEALRAHKFSICAIIIAIVTLIVTSISLFCK